MNFEVQFQLVAFFVWILNDWIFGSVTSEVKSSVLFLSVSISEELTSLVLSTTLISHRRLLGTKLKEQ